MDNHPTRCHKIAAPETSIQPIINQSIKPPITKKQQTLQQGKKQTLFKHVQSLNIILQYIM